jgi:hypothetical protein
MQLAAVTYAVVMGLTMANHGGEHVWDITAAEARQALYVRIPSYSTMTTFARGH